jgi:hypothetical protein
MHPETVRQSAKTIVFAGQIGYHRSGRGSRETELFRVSATIKRLIGFETRKRQRIDPVISSVREQINLVYELANVCAQDNAPIFFQRAHQPLPVIPLL